jgi:hypothetical protein
VRTFGLTVGRIIVIPGAARAFSGVEGVASDFCREIISSYAPYTYRKDHF